MTSYIGDANFNELLKLIGYGKPPKTIRLTNGMTAKCRMSSKKLVKFKNNRKCALCGIEGTIFKILKHDDGTDVYTPELYAITEDGEHVMMNLDHIIPKSKGGPDSMFNLDTMCFECNNKKQNKMPNFLKRLKVASKMLALRGLQYLERKIANG